MYEMKANFYTGIEMIDSEHKRLFDIADSAYQLLQNDFIADKYDDAIALLQELIDYTKTHFADEEKYMEEIGYRRILSQKVMHREFIDKLDSIDMNDVDADPVHTINEILKFLNEWLIEHILKMDMLIGH
jgi:hemerythrin